MNLDGELVGINLAVVQNAQSIGFAIAMKKILEGLQFYDQQKQAEAKTKQAVRVPVQ